MRLARLCDYVTANVAHFARLCDNCAVTTREEIEVRREKIAEAALRVLARDGLPELSVRNVAAEAGLAPSSLRYVIPTQASLREHAVDLVLDRLQARISAVTASDEPSWARTILLELMPLDEQRRVEMEVTLALGTAAMTDETLMPVYLRVHDTVRAVCARAARALMGADAPAAEVDRLHGLVDGLSLHIVRQPPGYGNDRAVSALDLHLQVQASSPPPYDATA